MTTFRSSIRLRRFRHGWLLTRVGFFVAAALVAATILGAVGQARAADQKPADAVAVQVGTVTMRPVATYSWIPGSIVSRSDARIASIIGGRVVWIAEIGQRVREGEPIAKLDDTLSRLRADDLHAQVERARAQRAVASSQLDRFNRLAATQVLSASQLDDARAQRDMSNEDVSRAEAQLGEAQYEVEQSLIRAPFSGVVTERFIQKGEYVQVGAPTVRLVNTFDIEARATAALELAANVRPGQEVTIRDHGVERTGRVRTIVPVGDDRSRQFEVRVAFEKTDWLVGTPVEVSLPSTTARTAVTVPRDALVIRQNHSYVLRVTRSNTVEQLDVTPGIAIADAIEVRGPLAPGDRLVVRGGERLSPGQVVKVINAELHAGHPG